MRYDITDLRLLLDIAETGSITSGAERSNLSLPAASARVRNLESEVGAPLFLRNSRGVLPTRAGEVLLHHARIVTLQLEQLDGEMAEVRGGMKGRVRLLCNTSALSEFLPDILGAFLARHGDVDVDVEERMSYDIVKSVRDGAADIGIAADSVDMGGLQTRPFRRDRLVVIGDEARLRTQAGTAGSIRFQNLLDADFVGLTADSALQRYLSQHARTGGRTIRLRARVRSFDAVCRLVHAGVGIAVIPETAAVRGANAYRLGVRPLSDAWASRLLQICARDFSALPRHAQALVERMADAAAAGIEHG
ncbi:MAG TPA: LysR substrate-binding domain-containing protein [Noviherbaspirillum sp.]|jgi:DNA-binding transcriptional LysR family regulator|uniref:LysR substrate-binding domain-containing protein n=1 Tax=Noviherbaspirillum sp. TaxID=1926288 RepID=UPI002F9249C1